MPHVALCFTSIFFPLWQVTNKDVTEWVHFIYLVVRSFLALLVFVALRLSPAVVSGLIAVASLVEYWLSVHGLQ